MQTQSSNQLPAIALHYSSTLYKSPRSKYSSPVNAIDPTTASSYSARSSPFCTLPGTASNSFFTGTLPFSPCASCTGLGPKLGGRSPLLAGVRDNMEAGKGCGAGLWSCFWGMVLVPSGQGPDIPSAATPFATEEGGAGGAAPPFVGVWKWGAG